MNRSRKCQGIRYVPDAQIYAVCLGRAMSMQTKLSPSKAVATGGSVTYAIRLVNPSTTALYTDFGLRVLLPPQVGYVQSAVMPALRDTVKGGHKTNVVPDLSGNAVTWPKVHLTPKGTRTFKIKARVAAAAPSGTSLTFAAYIFQTSVATGGTPFCDAFAPNRTVRFRLVGLNWSLSNQLI